MTTTFTLILSLAFSQSPPPLKSSITVTAERGQTGEAESAAAVIHTVSRDRLLSLPAATLGNALEGLPGVLVQQSTYAQVSPFLRGLTGYHVLNLIDGIRFNNSTFRSGPNQYLAFIEPSQAFRVESVLGPTGAQYGSDAMGGSIQILTPQLSHSSALEKHGEFGILAGSADLSAATHGLVQISSSRIAFLLGASGRRFGDLRPGGGEDSRHVLRRLFGIDGSSITGSRLPDTGFSQYGFHSKFSLKPRPGHLISLWYQRSELYGVDGYKDLWGGLGRLQSGFDPQGVDFAYARYEKLKLGPLDTLSFTFSANHQRDGTLRQNLRASDTTIRDDNALLALGYSVQAGARQGTRQTFIVGADIYDEGVRSTRFTTRFERPLYPDRAGYGTIGLFAQDSIELVPRKLRAVLAGRFSRIGFQSRADRALGVAASDLAFHDFTYQTSLSWQVSGPLALHVLAGRGFRAPNLNDLGALGLNDLGYEVPASEVVAAGALMGNNAGENAVSIGRRIQPLSPERLRNYELGFTLRRSRVYARVQAFHADLYDPIVRRTVLFPASQVPADISGISVRPIPPTAAQQGQGLVTVATPLDPRAVKAFVNDGQTRYYGLEWLARMAIDLHWHADVAYSFLAGRDLYPNRNVRRLPPQNASAGIRYTRRWWIESRLNAAGPQSRLSGGDIDDERIGASRRRSDIADFFSGSRIAPYIVNGRFRPTGETVTEIQNRVLPIGSVINGVRIVDNGTRVPLYLSTAGWFTVDIFAGIPVGENLQVSAGIRNIFDRNYRTHGSGVDAPGIGAFVGFSARF